MNRIAWMIERKIADAGSDWLPFKLAGELGGHVTRQSAREEAEVLRSSAARTRRTYLWTYRAVPYLPRVDSTGRRR